MRRKRQRRDVEKQLKLSKKLRARADRALARARGGA